MPEKERIRPMGQRESVGPEKTKGQKYNKEARKRRSIIN